MIGYYQHAKEALTKGRKITKKEIKVKHQRTITKLLRKAGESRADLVKTVKVPKTLARAEKLSEAYDRNLGAVARTFSFGLEVINLAMAVSDLSQDTTVLKAISATGAAADLGVVCVESFEIAVGSVLAVLFTDNAYEQFAEHSFLGESAHTDEVILFPWSPAEIKLPVKDRILEMQALIALLSNFRTDALSWDSVSIYPGYYRDGDKFELYVHHRYNNFKLGPLKFRVEIDLATGDIRQTGGNRPLADSSFILYDDTGRVKEIKVMIEEGIPRPDLLLPFKSQMMWVRLISKDGFTVPPRDATGKDAWHTSDYQIGSLNTGSTSGSSLDLAHRATTENNPPPNGLEEIK